MEESEASASRLDRGQHVEHIEVLARPASTIFAGQGEDIHTVKNLAGAIQELVALHIYRPALTQMELFDIVNGRIVQRAPETA